MVRKKAGTKEHYLGELKMMLQEGKEPKEKVLAVFCQRHGIPMEECRRYYNELLAGEKAKKA